MRYFGQAQNVINFVSFDYACESLVKKRRGKSVCLVLTKMQIQQIIHLICMNLCFFHRVTF